MKIELARSAPEYVEALSLPEPVARPKARAPEAPEAPEFTGDRQALAIGAQLAEFTENVPLDLRTSIANSTLLAHLAASKVADVNTDVFAWYNKYVEVLVNIGWQVRDLDFRHQTEIRQNLDMHEAIIPVITLALGPAAAAASIVVAILEGLSEMQADTPWITLFSRASQHAKGAKFQMSYIDADAQGNPEITLVCFGIEAESSITQVLFFKFTGQNATIKEAGTKLGVTLQWLESAKQAIADKVRPFISDYIANIDI